MVSVGMSEAAFRAPLMRSLARLIGLTVVTVIDTVAGEAAVHDGCRRILGAVPLPPIHQGRTIDIAISIGVVLVNDDSATGDELFRQADVALCEAKAAGRNTHQLLEAKVLARDSVRGWLALDMKDAIRRGDFFLVYQPIVDVSSGELLLRWQHPTRGMISPGDFISVAEETGKIVQLGAWAVEEACRAILVTHDRAAIATDLSGRAGQRAVCYLATVGALSGRVGAPRPSGFILDLGDLRAARVAARLRWQDEPNAKPPDQRSDPRIVPEIRLVTVRLPGGTTREGRIENLSKSGALFTVAAPG